MPECWGKSELLKRLLQAGEMGSLVAVPPRKKGTPKGMPYFTPQEREFNFWANLEIKGNGCWEWKGCARKHGYGWINWIGRKTILAHRLAWILSREESPDGMEVCHRCDNPPCCNPFHLFLGTHTDNIRDMDSKGRRKVTSGENCHLSKLKESDIPEIRRMSDSMNISQIARHFGVTPSPIRTILNGTGWKHVK